MFSCHRALKPSMDTNNNGRDQFKIGPIQFDYSSWIRGSRNPPPSSSKCHTSKDGKNRGVSRTLSSSSSSASTSTPTSVSSSDDIRPATRRSTVSNVAEKVRCLEQRQTPSTAYSLPAPRSFLPVKTSIFNKSSLAASHECNHGDTYSVRMQTNSVDTYSLVDDYTSTRSDLSNVDMTPQKCTQETHSHECPALNRRQSNHEVRSDSYDVNQTQRLPSISIPQGTESSNTALSMTSTAKPRPLSPLPPPSTRVWKSAVDPKSGRTYYYDVHTRETQWSKPLELATEQERKVILLKQQRQREFFAHMESNILRCMNRGEIIPSSSSSSPVNQGRSDSDNTSVDERATKRLTKPGKASLIRTISSMGDELLAEIIKTDDVRERTSDDESKGNQDRSPSRDITECLSTDLSSSHMLQKNQGWKEQSLLDTISFENDGCADAFSDTNSNVVTKPRLRKRNTCGTIYVGSTMALPDKDALIRCVCGVYRAHILSSNRSSQVDDHHIIPHDIFNDESEGNHNQKKMMQTFYTEETRDGFETKLTSESQLLHNAAPSLDEITKFYTFVFRKAQMESDCIIMSLIYVERLLRETNGAVRPTMKNWMSILFSCMILASKVWDDLSMWNVDFSQTCPQGVAFTLKRINELEVAVLSFLKYNVKVSASEYAKYYFLLRALTIRSGLGSDELRKMSPLDAEGAKRLEFLSSNFKRLPVPESVETHRRSRSLGLVHSTSSDQDSIVPSVKRMNLEEVVNMSRSTSWQHK